MSKLEEQLEALTYKLELMNAFREVNISFGKGAKFSDEVKKEVSNALHEVARLRVLALEEGEDLTEEKAASSQFSEEEASALRVLAQTILDKKNVASPKKEEPKAEKPAPQPKSKLTRGRLLLLDNLSVTHRKKVESNSQVIIVQQDDSKYFCKDEKGNTFWIPQEDVELLA